MQATRSTRQRSKPVILNLRKTEFGYEIIPEKGSSDLRHSKTSISKAEKSGSPSRAKNADQEGDASNENSMQEITRPLKTKNLTKFGAKNSGLKGKSKKSPSIQTDADAQKKDDAPSTPVSQALGTPLNGEDNVNEMTPSIEADRLEKPDRSDRLERLDRADKTNRLNGNRLMEPKILDFNTYEDIKQTKNYSIVVPSCADWFNFDTISQIEKEALPEFFMGKPSKSPEVYKKYRNFMINLYRQNPRYYLYSTTCRRNLSGDACGIIRIHAFLDHWGLINFNVDPSAYPQNLFQEKPNYNSEKLFRTSERQNHTLLEERDEEIAARNSENELLISQIRVLNKNSRPSCNGCGQICGLVWYQKKAQLGQQDSQSATSPYGIGINQNHPQPVETVLCLDCYKEGNLPQATQLSDFYKVDLLSKFTANFGKNPTPSSWTQEETIKLLDIISMSQDNWQEVQRYFPNKSLDDIILHYLQLPVKNIKATKPISQINENENLTSIEVMSNLLEVDQSNESHPLFNTLGTFKQLLNKLKTEKHNNSEAKLEEELNENIKHENQIEIEKLNEGEEIIKASENNAQKNVLYNQNMEIIDLGKDNNDVKKPIKTIEQFYSISEKQGELLEDLEKETVERANNLKRREEEKIRETANLILDLQINKLEAKLGFLEEYEKVLAQESKQHETSQRLMIADRINLVRKKLDAAKQPTAQTQSSNQTQTQSQPQPQNQTQTMYENQEPTYFGFNYPGAGVNMDELLNLGNHEGMDEFSAEHF